MSTEQTEFDALREHQAEERETWARALEQAVSERDAYKARVSRLEALARRGLEAYHHGRYCRFAHSIHPDNPAECENEACREWAAALEGK